MGIAFRKYLVAGISALILEGCVSQGTLLDRTAILQEPYLRWTEEDCRLIMKDCVSSNILDRSAPRSIVAIPGLPNFLLAYNCLKWKQHHCSMEEFLENTERQAQNCFGGAFDRNMGRFYNSRGHIIKEISEIDSLLLLIEIQNATDFRELAKSGFGALIASSLLTHLFPDITQMGTKIYLRTDGNIIVRPQYVRGSDASFLIKEEGYSAMFYLTDEIKMYLREHGSIDLYLELGDHPVVIPVKFQI